MFRVAVAQLVLVSFVFSTACSYAAPATQSIAIQPSHPNAEIFVDGASVGHGPMSVTMSKRNSHTVMAKCGNSAGVSQVDQKLSTLGTLDLVGTFLIIVPVIGVFAPGFWDLDPPIVAVAVPDASGCEAPSRAAPAAK